jgi:FKBP-type peptidyl-prolyl cis-trans isomerase FklB
MTSTPPRRGRSVLIAHTAVALLAGALLAQAQQPPAGSAPSSAAAPAAPAKKAAAKTGGATTAATPKSTASYGLGVSWGEQLRGAGVTPDAVSIERLAQGVRDGMSGKAKLTDADKQAINDLVRSAREAAAETNHRAAAKFLAENGKKPDVVTTASGLQYKVITAGSGASPKATDTVMVNYRGTLLDGTEFDSSYKRGEPATFPVNHVIPGWTEALQLMKPGGKYQLFVPPQLAYDLRSPTPAIPAGSMLIFDVELVSVKPPAEQPGAATAPAQPDKPQK